ncbi:phosphotransferase [Cellulomonas sp. JZ18]|uniref:phosphotransferase n=1 Tax=Cellulomonas sp. JZ18 TaxID=2654191 RepID=UPI0012D493A8|nr:phosphotransferase [Cellulomonas sp. JZ18]QGQ18092.1 phosphotransferase [Cellulomonas sp. JZ18]
MTAPADEVPISADVVTALLAEQHPDLAALPVGRRHSGWDMAMYRLGDDLAVRLPRRAASVGSLEAELRWVPELSRGWTFPTQRVVRVGVPGAVYPWPWAVVTWLPGVPASERPLGVEAGPALGRALAEIHVPVPAGVEPPLNREQSVALAERGPGLASALDLVAASAAERGVRLDRAVADAIWAEALAAPVDLPRTWIHADLHPYNLLSDDGRLGGIIDWADVAGGDPATDLGFLWLSLPPDGLAAAVEAYGGVSAATLARARGVALALAAGWAVWEGEELTIATGWRAMVALGVVR